MELWFTEKYSSGWGISLKITRGVYSGRSRYQKIDILETLDFGKILVIDGATMLTEKDEFAYHEMLIHVPFFSHPNPEEILIIGGGDGGAVREICRHKCVKKIDLVEIDKQVIELCQKYFPSVAYALKDEKVNILIEDGIEYLKKCPPGKYDIIIVDSTDPIGPAVGLFQKEFYASCFNALKNDGILNVQSGSPYFQEELIEKVFYAMQEVFPISRTYLAGTPTYGGMWSFTLGSKLYDPIKGPQRRDEEVLNNLKYYNEGIHTGAFQLPNYLLKRLGLD